MNVLPKLIREACEPLAGSAHDYDPLLDLVGDTLPNGARQGITDFKRTGYGGPCPPPGKPHRYFFKLYALDTELALKSRATRPDLLKAMQGHVLAEASLMGVYQRCR